MKLFRRHFLLALFNAIILGPISAAERVAIVFGNDAYTHAPKLQNAINDAGAVAEMLETKLEFKLIKPPKERVFSRQESIWSDCDLEQFYAGIEAFKKEAATADLGLVYYAGHGMEVEKTNYLIPVDAELSSRVQLRTQAVKVVDILADLKSTGLPNKLLILDCCRDDPLTRSWRGTRSSAKGLAELTDTDIPESTLILFSAAPGQAALDGEGENSPFTASLIEELPKPGRDALDAFFEVSDAVVKKTGNRQEPWIKFDGAGRTFREFQFVEGQERMKSDPAEVEKLRQQIAAMAKLIEDLEAKGQRVEALKAQLAAMEATEKETPDPAPEPMKKTTSSIAMIPQPTGGGGFSSDQSRGFTNSLGMKFVPVPGTDVLFSVYETRVKDYAAFAAENPSVDMSWKDFQYEGHKQTSDHPVVNVMWGDAVAFCAWLSKKKGRTYRLPTDHEWSVAVGIGDRENASASPESKDEKIADVYPWGTTWPPPTGSGNYSGKESSFSNQLDDYRDNHPFTAPVGSFDANQFGVHDLGGNVMEWCNDQYDSEKGFRVLNDDFGNFSSRDSLSSTGGGVGDSFLKSYRRRVVRGGSWRNSSRDSLLSASRCGISLSSRSDYVGFRCVVEASGKGPR